MLELLMALIVEGFRELQEAWANRMWWRRAVETSAVPLPSEDAERRGAAGEPATRITALTRMAHAEAQLEGVLERHGRKHVGVAIGLLVEGEMRTFGRGRIARDRSSPAVADAIFEIGSITKVFTATLLADMVQSGEVALDDPVQRYLPQGTRLPVRGRAITLADLASHTSGLPRLPPGFIRRALRQRRNPWAGYTVEDLDAAAGAARLHGEPGARFRYSNLGYGLLGQALAHKTQTSYQDLVRERICEPLALIDTSISVPAAKLERFAEGHDRRGRPVPHWDLPALPAAGALRSTVADMLALLAAHLGEADTTLTDAARLTHAPRARRGRLTVGLGWLGLPLRGGPHEVLFHNGGTGGFRCFCGLVRQTRSAVVVLSNSARSVDAIGFRLLEALSKS
jgi:D-alanyl-D-alanine-carboxypeptidase/D-alanyl-D-alanine-endopeptidase